MCNHYAKNAQVIQWAAAQFPDVAVEPSGDILEHTWPKSLAPVIIQENSRFSVSSLRWGVPVQLRGASKPRYVTNARDDSLTKYTWRYSVATRRCLIPATCYFEPDGPPGAKWEVRFSLREQDAFFVAGLWSVDDVDAVRSFAMVTTSPNELAATIHDRMPLVLDLERAKAWLGQEPLAPATLNELCRPFPAAAMSMQPLPPPTRPIRKEDLPHTEGDLPLLF